MKYTYTAFDKSGASVSGSGEAGSETELGENLRKQGLFVTEMREAGASTTTSGAGGKRPGTGMRLRCLAMFSRQMHVLLSSGTPIVQALNAIERQSENPTWGAVIASLRKRVEEGSPMSEGMRVFPHYFDATTRSLIAAGEASGNLPMMLDRLASLSRKQLHLRTTVLGAMVYPTLLITIGFVVLLVMLMFVLPRFSDLFGSLDTPLPPTTKLLLWMSGMLWGYWWAMILLVGGAVAGAYFWLQNPAGERAVHTATINLPKFGRLSRSVLTAKTARMLGTLLESKIPLLEALQLTIQGTKNCHYSTLLSKAEEAVGRGESISAVLGESDLINPCVQEALRNSEHTGQIGLPLLQMADFLDEENDVVIKSLTSIIEPLILLALGVMVGFIAMSMFLPLFDLVSAANSGGAK